MSKHGMMLVAVALTLLASVVMAQDINYRVYGVAHVSTDLQNNGDDSELFVSSNTNRVGIKGEIDTDNDLFTVVFQYESQADFNAGNGDEAAVWANRNSFAGVKGEWGRLIWGRHDTPFKSLGRQIEYFAERIGDARNATQYHGAGWDNRPRNMVMYNTPALGEMVTLNLQYVPDQGVEDGSAYSASAIYDKDALMVGVAIEGHGEALEAGPEDAMGIRGAVHYQGEVFSVGGLVQSLSNVGGVDDVKGLVWGLGADYLVAPTWDLKAQFYMLDPDTDTDDNGAKMLVAGVDYILNESARLYLAYATMMNDDNAAYVPFRGGHGQSFGAVAGESAYGISAGLTVGW